MLYKALTHTPAVRDRFSTWHKSDGERVNPQTLADSRFSEYPLHTIQSLGT